MGTVFFDGEEVGGFQRETARSATAQRRRRRLASVGLGRAEVLLEGGRYGELGHGRCAGRLDSDRSTDWSSVAAGPPERRVFVEERHLQQVDGRRRRRRRRRLPAALTRSPVEKVGRRSTLDVVFFFFFFFLVVVDVVVVRVKVNVIVEIVLRTKDFFFAVSRLLRCLFLFPFSLSLSLSLSFFFVDREDCAAEICTVIFICCRYSLFIRKWGVFYFQLKWKSKKKQREEFSYGSIARKRNRRFYE